MIDLGLGIALIRRLSDEVSETMVGLVEVLVLGMMLGVVLVLGMVIVVVLVPVPDLDVLVMMRVRMSVLMKGAVVTVIGLVVVLVSSSFSMSTGTLSACPEVNSSTSSAHE